MRIVELYSLTESQVTDLLKLMKELNPTIHVTQEMLENTVKSPDAHLFVLEDDSSHIIGYATISVYYSPTGRKANVEDVVVLSSYRGQHLGKALMEHIIDYGQNKLVDVDLCLTSHTDRVIANSMYKALGFKQKETNVYRMVIRESKQL